MHVLVTGATGFLGQRVADALVAAGHTVRRASRRPPPGAPDAVAVDFAHATAPVSWTSALAGVDAVVNTVGVFRETREQPFDDLHVAAPTALFQACVAAGVKRVVHVSAVGADAGATSAYHLTKRAGDDALRALPLQAAVVQPSLVYGPGGASARLFSMWSTLPVLPVPGDGTQAVQPVHVDDAVDAIVALVTRPDAFVGTLPLVGPEPLTLRSFLERLRAGLGLPAAQVLHVPMGAMRLVARLGNRWPSSLLDEASLGMLERGNTADAGPLQQLLGRPPRPVAAFAAADRPTARAWALSLWTLPLLRWSIAAVWIVTGVLSLGIFPADQSLALLARVGAEGGFAALLLYGAAALDLAFGIATLLLRRRRLLWAAQFALILGYTVLITWRLPEFWLHPFGPILKNLPMLAAICVLWASEPREETDRWTT